MLRIWHGDVDRGYASLPLRRAGDHHSMLAALRRGDLEVVLFLGQNPMRGSGNPRGVASALARIPLLVSIDPFLNDTARFWEDDAECKTDVIVLPSASFAEKPGSRTNACRRVQWQEACAGPRGASRPDAWILDALYQRLGLETSWPGSGYRDIFSEITRACWLYEGLSAETGKAWRGPRLLEALPLEVRLWTDRVPDGPLPEYYAPPGLDNPLHPGQPSNPLLRPQGSAPPCEARERTGSPDLDYPLLLSTAMSGAEGRRCAARGERGGLLEVQVPGDEARALAFSDRDRVWLETPEMRAPAVVRVVRGTARGVVWAPSYWGAHALEGKGILVVDPGDPETLLDDVRLVPCRLVRRQRAGGRPSHPP
jgi:anaerobic selenocysteine-containing dehydrogenase